MRNFPNPGNFLRVYPIKFDGVILYMHGAHQQETNVFLIKSVHKAVDSHKVVGVTVLCYTLFTTNLCRLFTSTTEACLRERCTRSVETILLSQ